MQALSHQCQPPLPVVGLLQRLVVAGLSQLQHPEGRVQGTLGADDERVLACSKEAAAVRGVHPGWESRLPCTLACPSLALWPAGSPASAAPLPAKVHWLPLMATPLGPRAPCWGFPARNLAQPAELVHQLHDQLADIGGVLEQGLHLLLELSIPGRVLLLAQVSCLVSQVIGFGFPELILGQLLDLSRGKLVQHMPFGPLGL